MMTLATTMVLLAAVATLAVDGLMFYMPPSVEKCFTDEYAFDVLVSGEFRVTTPGQANKMIKLLV
jgi:hypothetical protein